MAEDGCTIPQSGQPNASNRNTRQIVPVPLHLRVTIPGLATELAIKTPCRREIIHDGDHNVYSVFSVLRNERTSTT